MTKLLNKIKFTLLALFTAFISFQSIAQSQGFELIKNMEIMDLIYENLDKYYVDEPQVGKLSKTGIDAMLRELDPYTVYYHESNMEDYLMMTTGQYGGIGSLIRKIGDYIYIAEPYQDSPSQKAGLVAGDKIIAIDGKSMAKKDSEEVSNSLKGPKGTTIQIEVEREGQGNKTISVTRDEIKLPDVPYSGMISTTVGYIKLNSFTQTASADVKKAFETLQSEGMKELIFDLRGNGGGLLIEAVKIVNFFVKKGQVVVTTKGRVQEENRVYSALEEPLDLAIPITVLIDEGSASASEIVSGSLQDLDRAVVVGATSYGKGLVQRTYDLKYGSKMKLTIAKYYTPSGRCVQRLEYYDHREGKPKEISDSLLKIFKTTNGRDVIDGRGIEPDVKIEEEEYSRLTGMLFTNNLVFNYATKFHSSHPTIAPADAFALSEEEYADFKNYVLGESFTYSTASEEMLQKMKETAEEEGYFEDTKSEYEALLAKVVPSKERDLEKFKKEILTLLENEIVSRYYFQKGRAEHSFKSDPAIARSLEILANIAQYNTILKK